MSALKMFYTKEEIEAFTLKDKIAYRLQSFWYNFTEWFLTLKESDKRWMDK